MFNVIFCKHKIKMPSRSRSRSGRRHSRRRRRFGAEGNTAAPTPGWVHDWVRMPRMGDVHPAYKHTRKTIAGIAPETVRNTLRPAADWLETQIEQHPEYFVYIPMASFAVVVSALGLRAAWPRIRATWQSAKTRYFQKHRSPSPSASRSRRRRSTSSRRRRY